jgi:hypothetical protein
MPAPVVATQVIAFQSNGDFTFDLFPTRISVVAAFAPEARFPLQTVCSADQQSGSDEAFFVYIITSSPQHFIKPKSLIMLQRTAMLYSSLLIVLTSLVATPLSASQSPPLYSHGPLQVSVESPFPLTEPQVRYAALWEEFSFVLAECLCGKYIMVLPAHNLQLPPVSTFFLADSYLMRIYSNGNLLPSFFNFFICCVL